MKKPMTKKLLFLTLILTITTALGFWAFSHKEVLQIAPWTSGMNVENVSDVQMDRDGNYYLIDQSLRRFSKINSDKNYQFHIDITDRNQSNSLYLAKDFTIDEAGNIFILKIILDATGINIQSEEIVHYNADGEFEDVIHKVTYDSDEKITRPGRLHELNYTDETLYFYEMDGDDVVEAQEITIHELNPINSEIGVSAQFTLPEEIFISEIKGNELGNIYYATKRAEIYHIDEMGESQLLYSSRTSERENSFPVAIDFDMLGNVFFVDIGRQEINRLNAVGDYAEVNTLLSSEALQDTGFQFSLQSAGHIHANEDGSLLSSIPQAIIHMDAEGQVQEVLSSGDYSMTTVFFQWIVWFVAIFIFLLAVLSIKIIYIDILRGNTSIIVKQVLIFIPVIIASLLLVSSIVYFHFSQSSEEEVFNKLKLLAHAGAQINDKDRMERISKPEDFMNDDYRYIDRQNRHMLQGNQDLDAEGLYSVIYAIENEEDLFVLMLFNTSVGTYYPIQLGFDYTAVVNEGKILTERTQEIDGEWLFALGPIYNKDDQLIGMQEVGMPLYAFEESRKQLFWNVGGVILVLIPVIAVIFLLMTYYMLSSIRKLSKSVEEIAQGNWEVSVDIDTGDEVGDLGNQFNKMAKQIGSYVMDMKNVSEAYYRFVPEQFLHFLGKSSILNVSLGDQVKQEMNVMVSTIRSFYTLSKHMTPEENFHFINSFYETVGPVVREHEGLVNTYLSAGLMALFPKKPLKALQCAVKMRREVEKFNETQWDEVDVDIGIVIHKGPLMLGIVGEKERMSGNVISEDVNISIILEKYSEKLGVSILISESALKSFGKMKKYHYRRLGRVELPEMDQPLELYDVFEGDKESVRKKKSLTQDTFESAVTHYQEGRFFDARTGFLQVIKENESDKAAKLYFYLCDEYFQKGTPPEWKGTLEL